MLKICATSYKKALFCVLLLVFLFPWRVSLQGQIPVGGWRAHFPYNHTHDLAIIGDKVYGAAQLALFSYNRTSGQLQTLNTTNGLNDVGIASIASKPGTSNLFVGYNNGNLDILKDGRVTNYPMLKNASMQGEKRIRDIHFYKGQTYLATGVGIMVFDTERLEIRETYQISAQAGNLLIYQLAHNATHFYAASANGLYRAPASGVNLMDYNNWELLENLPQEKCLGITHFQDRPFALFEDASGGGRVYYLQQGTWQVMDIAVDMPRKIYATDNSLFIAGKNRLRVFNGALQITDVYEDYGFSNPKLNDMQQAEDGSLWLADDYYGIVKPAANRAKVFRPNGPANAYASDITYASDLVLVAGGGKPNPYSEHGMYYFDQNKWRTINKYSDEGLKGVKNLTFLQNDPGNPGHFFAASWGYGLVEFQDNEVVRVYDERTPGSPLKPIEPYGHGYLRLSGLDMDENGTLWMASTSTTQPVYGLTKDKEWIVPDVSGYGFGSRQTVGNLVATEGGNIWVTLPDRGFLIVSPDGRRTKVMDFVDENGERIDAQITHITQDKDGVIWVGTNSGIALYHNPGYVFESGNLAASRIVVNNTYLLKYDVVTDIVVDGGNRKWIGTGNSGALLLSGDGRTQLEQFTSQNSPLPAEGIVAIGIDEERGEVYFETDNGLVSYRSNARKGEANFEDVYVYPNPVREDFKGLITVDGLMANTRVKITDVSGNLVHQGESEGAVFTWDGKRRDGKRVNTGVYLVFCATPDGEFSKVTKFLVIQN